MTSSKLWHPCVLSQQNWKCSHFADSVSSDISLAQMLNALESRYKPRVFTGSKLDHY